MTQRAITASNVGARFFRGDLHVHSHPASHDVADTTMTPANIVATAQAEGLSILAITDHNEIGNVAAAIAAAESGLLVVPGVELSTPQGHLLVYCRTMHVLEAFYGKLSIVERGTQTSRCQTSLLDCLKLLPPRDGFAILAHVDVATGFETMVPGAAPHKVDVLTHPALLGIELKNATSPISYAQSDPDKDRAQMGAKRRARLATLPQQTIARVLSSDSHTLTALGRNAQGAQRLTRYKMDAPSFDGLMIALRDYEARVRLEDDVPSFVPRVVSVKINGGFLDGQDVLLSPNLTCIIGGRGAGKSTLFEAIRVLSPYTSKSGIIDGDTWPDVLELEWTDESGAVQQLVRRRSEETENVSDAAGPTTFPIECYGQGETASTSKRAQTDPTALLEYLDQFVDIRDLRDQDEGLRNDLIENQKKLEEATLKIADIPKYESLLAQTKQQVAALAQAEAKEVLEMERRLADARRRRTLLEESLTAIGKDYRDFSSHARVRELLGFADPTELKEGESHCRGILDLAKATLEQLEVSSKTIEGQVKALVTASNKHISEWKLEDRTLSEAIDSKRKELQAKGLKLDYAFIKKVAQDEASHQKSLETLRTWKPYKTGLETERRDLLKRRDSLRDDIYTRRVAFGSLANKALEGALADLSVTVKFTQGALCPEAETLIQNAMGWRTIQVPRATTIVEQLTVPHLIAAIRKNDPAPIRSLKDKAGVAVFSATDALELLDRLGVPAVLYQLERLVLEDHPHVHVTKDVTVSGGSKPITREFAKLSLGQQQSVLLALMLASSSKSPLFIDQPEDNLDSEFIYHSLVPILRRAKERRQVIVVTHNANIAVLGDAELVVALKGISDKGTIMARGSIDADDIRKMACQILEGAEDAFIRRAKVYGLPRE